MNAFSIVTGIVGTIGVFLWFKDAFPQYSQYLLYGGFICLGLVIGLIISLFHKKVEIKSYKLTFNHVFVYGFYLFMALFIVILLFVQPTYFLQIISGIAIFILISFNHLLSLVRQPWVSITERVILANEYEKQWNYSEVIYQYGKIIESLDEKDERIESIKQKLSLFKSKQLQ